MNRDFQLIILSMPKSPRIFLLKKRLKELKIKNYKLFYGNNGSNKEKKNIVYSYYNKKKAEKFIGRPMTFNEIGAEVTTIRAYKYIVKNRIKNAIIMHDDIYPSVLFKEWVDKKFFLNGLKIIGFFSAPPGFLRKKSSKILMSTKISLHHAKTHVFISQCMQITYDFCKFYLNFTKSRVCGQNDFSFNFKKNGIQVFQTIPYLVYPDDKGISFLKEERNIIEKPLLSIKVKERISKYTALRKFLNLLRIIYYLSFIPFFFKECSYSYYKEYFFDKYKISLINFFLRRYIDINKQYVDSKNYPNDLKKFVKLFTV
jgi:hypothetical protein